MSNTLDLIFWVIVFICIAFFGWIPSPVSVAVIAGLCAVESLFKSWLGKD